MGKKTNILTTIATATVISTTSVNADTLKDNDINKIVCTTKQSCEKLSNSIQTQINELKNKGIANLSDNEFDKYAKLKKKFIAVEKSETQLNEDVIAKENQKQLEQKNTIARENNKQEIEDEKHKANQEYLKTQEQIKEQLTSIKGSFL